MNRQRSRKVTRARDRVTTLILPLLFLLLSAGSVHAAEEESVNVALESDESSKAGESFVPHEEGRQVETLEQKGGYIGYSLVGKDGSGVRAREYSYLHASRSGGLFYRKLQSDSNLEVEGAFLNEHDYHGDLLLDYRGDYRLHLRTESLYHNLDRELLFSPGFDFATTAGTAAQYVAVQDQNRRYGVSVVQDSADFRYRLHNYPLHVNLGYWRLVRDGSRQQRFGDVSFEAMPDDPATPGRDVTVNRLFAERRRVNQQTHEGRFGADAHLGPVDLIYDFKIRVFEDRLSTPSSTYIARDNMTGTLESRPGAFVHNDEPDSRFISNTIKLHSSLAGGLVGSGSYSIEERENLSDLNTGARHTKANLHNAAGDLIYTPSKEYTFAVKYRRQELDYDNRTAIYSSNLVGTSTAKAHIDTTRDIVTATALYKPRRDLSLNGEYRGEFLRRNNVSGLPSTTSWTLPESTDTHVGSLTANYRPMTGVRFSANYGYTTVDHPSYGASFDQKHEGKLLATYTRNNGWGSTASLVVRRESNDKVEHFLISSITPVTYTDYPLTARERRVLNGNVSAWVVPFERLTVGANYAYLENRAEQAVLFTIIGSASEAASTYFARSHVYGVNAAYAFTDNFDFSLMLQQVRSSSAFKPDYTVFSSTSDTSGISDITKQNTVINNLSGRGEYRFSQALSASLEYTLSEYDESNSAYSAYNGTVHTVFATFGAKW